MNLETYDTARERWRYLRDAYLGGEYWATPSATTLGAAQLSWRAITEDGQPVARRDTARSYLVPHDGESDEQFARRSALSAYVNLVAPIVKAYAEATTAGVKRTMPGLDALLDDVDHRGASWGEWVESAAKWAALYGVVAAVVDAPAIDASQMSVAEAQARAVRPYAVLVHPAAWAWVQCDAGGRLLEFAYVSTPYLAPEGSASSADVTLRVWRAAGARDTKDPGGWEERRGAVAGGRSLGTAALEVIDSGPLPDALGGDLPVVFAYYERDDSAVCPRGVSLVADAADHARLIFNALSWASEIHRKAGFPFLAIPLSNTGGQLDQATAVKIGPGQGLGYSSASGVPQWVAPSAESTKELREHAVFLFQLALRTCGLEVAADASAQVQSGEALRLRSRDFESRAARFARNLQRFERKVARLFAVFAGEDPEAQQIAYAKRFTLPDPSEDLSRALALLQAPAEIGPTARVAAVVQAADAALTLTDEELAQVAGEVERANASDLDELEDRRATEATERASKRAAHEAARNTPEAPRG